MDPSGLLLPDEEDDPRPIRPFSWPEFIWHRARLRSPRVVDETPIGARVEWLAEKLEKHEDEFVRGRRRMHDLETAATRWELRVPLAEQLGEKVDGFREAVAIQSARIDKAFGDTNALGEKVRRLENLFHGPDEKSGLRGDLNAVTGKVDTVLAKLDGMKTLIGWLCALVTILSGVGLWKVILK